MREKNEALEHRIQLLEARLHETPVMNRPVVPFLHNPVVVSPDSLALGGDSLSRTKAWVKAVSELKILLLGRWTKIYTLLLVFQVAGRRLGLLLYSPLSACR